MGLAVDWSNNLFFGNRTKSAIRRLRLSRSFTSGVSENGQTSRIGPAGQASAVRQTSPMNNASMPDLRNVTIASVGVQTIGSLSLKDMLMTSGTPVRAYNLDN